MKTTVLVVFVCSCILTVPALSFAENHVLVTERYRSFVLENPRLLNTRFLLGTNQPDKAESQRIGYGNSNVFENLNSTMNVYYTLIGVGAVALTSTLVVGNSVAFHTRAKNRMGWGVSGVVFGSVGIATSLSLGLYSLAISPKGAWPFFLIPFAVSSVYLGLGVANIVSSKNDSIKEKGQSQSGPLLYAIPWLATGANHSVTVGLSFVGMNF